ncbi:DNA mismatch repair endonuclease MutL [Pseudolactococcus paracarnosus]|uniref:DNA mismatch repair protein MutL n=1 Tax=Pseudolactococcus paracarnosus TaxID=2749962 RepID=A0ABT0ANX0_9LACT|nr:DNA mismatch repair endonuclease MutL [Lactococcus paracarnosus]MCJ1978244.1 DNA mismatch repair endonuclease MutL [Lactococcus paracarnosus]MCJ1984387.1 DNA mismatch repair endonuclease MutL [Lactococcus paracarnosus]MCJ1999037.1 DNA mismatch repair endonuclease MutL [Lactococcus paracarnosus]
MTIQEKKQAKIIELDENLANKIAAGEVIERPASVVKELLENAIDAAATQITVKIEESGLKSIEIIDNGEGIARDEVALALKRHATSKIKDVDDLFRIRTLGFRGEALPSIASVSELTINTAVADNGDESGTLLIAKGGDIIQNDAAPKRVGTRIKVENLFYNTPARLKYIKSLQAELSHITDIINRLSLAHSEVAFTLINDGREMMKTAGTGDLRQAIAGVYGISTAKKMLAISNSDLDFEVSGYVSLPELTRANRNYITILLNGRYIKNFLINRAIVDGYGSKLMVGRFPLAIIDIKIDPFLADVNVHPTKQEVRISKERELMVLITRAISQALQPQTLIPNALENLNKSTSTAPPADKAEQTSLPLTGKQLYYDSERQDFYVQEKATVDLVPTSLSELSAIKDRTTVSSSAVETISEATTEAIPEESSMVNEAVPIPFSDDEVGKKTFPELEFLAQMHGTYLLCQSPEGLYIVDQHAAQERVKYEYYREKIGQVNYDQQQLLVPILIRLTQDEIGLVLDKKELLAEAGVFLAAYGDDQLILREHPIWMNDDEIESATYELIDLLLAGRDVSVKKYREDLAIMIACKSSIKANMFIDPASARDLLQQLAQCKNPYNCPHGRPALVSFSNTDLEKMFRRIQQTHKGGWHTQF